MSQSQEPAVYDTVGNRQITKRGFMRGLAGAAGAATVGGAAIRSGTDPVEAIDLKKLGATSIIGGPIAIGWLMRDYIPDVAQSPSEGLTADALEESITTTARTRKSTNASTLVDNRNLIQAIDGPAYSDAKIAAVEALNDGLSQADVEAAALDELESYATTLEKNLIKSWNESVRELRNLNDSASSHPDIDDYLKVNIDGATNGSSSWTYDSNSQTLRDGTTIDIEALNFADGGGRVWDYDLTEVRSDDVDFQSRVGVQKDTSDGNQDYVFYLNADDWTPIWTDLQNVIDSVNNGLITWVGTIYTEVQSGDIETSDLLSPREIAQLSADSEDQFNQAIADLVALNQPVDPDNLATIKIPDVSATLRGTFAVTDETTTIEAGNTYDPETDFTGSVYFTYDISEGSGDWTAYNLGVDGGTVTFTSEPYEGVEYQINTKAGETVTATAANFTNDGTGNWEADLSTELEETITEVESVDYFPDDTETRYETIQLRNSFEVVSFEDQDGNDVQSANFERSSEPHDDTNYITQQEFDDQQARIEELIQKYEDSQNDSLHGGSFNLGSIGTNGGIIAAIAATLVGYGIISN